MDKIDRLGWAEGLAFSCLGVRIGIRASQPGFLRTLEHLLPPGRKPISGVKVDRLFSVVVGGTGATSTIRRVNLAYDGAARIARDRELAPVLKTLEREIRRSVAEKARRRVFIHAGVVELGGRAILLPGVTMSGKSTLVAELVKRGATYYSDEYAVLDERGFVHPFAKPLSLRIPGTVEAFDHSVQEFGGRAGVKRVPVGLVAVSHFDVAARWRPRTLTPGQGVLALLSHAIAARTKPRTVMGTLRRAVAHATVLKGVRGEAAEVAQWLMATVQAT
jgi:hypothetical protein